MKSFAENRLCRHGGCEKYWISDSRAQIQIQATTASVAISVNKSVERDMSLCTLGEYEVGSVRGILYHEAVHSVKKRKRAAVSDSSELTVRRAHTHTTHSHYPLVR